MKRSEINKIVLDGAEFFKTMNFALPPFANYSLPDWKKNKNNANEIFDLKLGWDITDFGSGDFKKVGLLLFTLRNGESKRRKYSKPYAEKAMIVEKEQVTPMHFHWLKMEDIINRGGGNLVMELYSATENESLSKGKISVSIDGIQRTFKAGDKVVLKPGESICLTPRLYHTFWAEKKKTFVGEVSCVNDDTSDNRFLNPVGRFPEIEEDEAPLFILCSEYQKLLNA